MNSGVRMTVSPASVTPGRPVHLLLRVVNHSRHVLDGVRLVVAPPRTALCLDGELRQRVGRWSSGESIELPLTVNFEGPGDAVFHVELTARRHDGDQLLQLQATVAVRAGPDGTDPMKGARADATPNSPGTPSESDGGLDCAVRLERAGDQFRIRLRIDGPGGVMIDEVRTGLAVPEQRLAIPARTPLELLFRVAIPTGDTVERIGIGYRTGGGIRRQHALRVPLRGRAGGVVLFVAANPGGSDASRNLGCVPDPAGNPATAGFRPGGWLQTDLEYRWLEESLRGAPGLRLAPPSLATSYASLLQHLVRERPRILHFAGHGEERHLLLHGDDHSPQSVPAEAVRDAVGAIGQELDLVVLNACWSESVGRSLRPLARRVVAVSGPVPDASAVAFVRGFYTVLAGEPMADAAAVDRAFRAGCGAVAALGADARVFVMLG